MTTFDDTRHAVGLMLDFADRTGLTSSHLQRRYLWTDAFAVCNFLALERRLDDEHFGALALMLVERVHHTLGQHRHDAPRRGWLSGLSAAEAEAHPTVGGLRIGKRLPERLPGQVADPDLEWEQDGQYFHDLTKWMHALDQAASRLRRPQLNRWARELAETAYRRFVNRSSGTGAPSMFWKMSIDLSRPLVASTGHHDPLDGWITCAQLQTSAARFAEATPGPALTDAVTEFARMTAQRDLSTTDALGLGGLLTDAYRAQQLSQRGVVLERGLVSQLLWAAAQGLAGYVRLGELRAPAAHRLAFRELGLAIGISALERLAQDLHASPDASYDDDVPAAAQALSGYSALGTQIRSFWSKPETRSSESWDRHRDINDVMLATSLVPEGFLVLG
jgi:hypothetical protein